MNYLRRAITSSADKIDVDAHILDVKELSGSDDPPYDFPIPGISPSLVTSDPSSYVEKLKGLTIESDEDFEPTPRVRPELEVQSRTPRLPGHFSTSSEAAPAHKKKGVDRDPTYFSPRNPFLPRNSNADTPKAGPPPVTASGIFLSSSKGFKVNHHRNMVASTSSVSFTHDPTTTTPANAATTKISDSATEPRADLHREIGASRDSDTHSSENFDVEASASDEESQGLAIRWSQRVIRMTNTKMYWTTSDSTQDLIHPVIPGAAVGHIHLHRNSRADHVQVWLLESESTWVDYSSRYGGTKEPFIGHPIYSALVLTTRGSKKAPSFVSEPYLRKKIEKDHRRGGKRENKRK